MRAQRRRSCRATHQGAGIIGAALGGALRGGALLGGALLGSSGCGVQQRAAEALIDPQLHANGVMVERQSGMRDLQLGRYRVAEHTLRPGSADSADAGPLGPDASGRTRPTTQVQMSFRLLGGVADWTAQCVGWRRQPPDADFADIADEQRDEVALRCEIRSAEQRWLLELDGDLGSNVHGRLYPAGATAEAKRVDVIIWRRLWNITRRRLPATLACIVEQTGTADAAEAALILDTPERAWLDPQLDDVERELELTALLAVRLIPLGFEE